jgi:hypothetical protein
LAGRVLYDIAARYSFGDPRRLETAKHW